MWLNLKVGRHCVDRPALPAEALAAVVRGVPGVRDCRDMRTRGGADSVYVDLVPLRDGSLPLRAAPDVADAIEDALQRTHPEIVDVLCTWNRSFPGKEL